MALFPWVISRLVSPPTMNRLLHYSEQDAVGDEHRSELFYQQLQHFLPLTRPVAEEALVEDQTLPSLPSRHFTSRPVEHCNPHHRYIALPKRY